MNRYAMQESEWDGHWQECSKQTSQERYK
jgi:hypothetical protein